MKTSKKNFWGVTIVSAVALLAHFQAIGGDFHFDDFHHIVNNPAVKNFPGWFYFFTHPEGFSAFGKFTLYRPLTLLSFALNYRLFGKDPEWWLIFNVLLHSLNSGLVFLLLRRWLKEFRPALLGGLFFSVMPILSQPVNYLSNRATLFATGFVLLGLLFSHWANEDSLWRKIFRLLLALACFWLGLFSKEFAVVFPALVLIMDLSLNRLKQDRFRIFANLIYWLNLGIFFWLRNYFFGTLGSDYYPRSFGENLWLQSKVIFYYLAKIFYPIHLSVLPELGPGEFWSVFFWILLLGTSLLALVFWRRIPVLTLGWFWFLIGLLPSGLMPLNVVVNEERVYLPAVGIVLGLSWFLEGILKKRARWGYGAVGLILVCFVAILEKRIPAWRDEISLWRDTIWKSPRISAGYVMYGNAFYRAGELGKALAAYARALHYDDKNPQALAGMCQIYLRAQNLDLVKQFGKRYEEVSVHPHQKADALSYQALAELSDKNYEEAGRLAEKALELYPEQVRALYVQAVFFHLQGEMAKAEQMVREVVKKDPDFASANELLGLLLTKQGKVKEALPFLERYTELMPRQEGGWFHLGMAYLQLGRIEDARMAIERALQENPNYALGYYGRAVVEWSAKERRKALEAMAQALKLEPENKSFHFAHLGMLVKSLEDGSGVGVLERKEMLQLAHQEVKWLKAHQEKTEEFENRLRRLQK